MADQTSKAKPNRKSCIRRVSAGISEFTEGPLSQLMHSQPPRHEHHHGWEAAILASCSFTMVICLVKRAKRLCRQRRYQKHGIVSQLSELSAQSAADTNPNPLLQGPLALAVHNADLIPKSETDWIQNVPWSDWQIDQEDITICRRPDGRLWELGSGASAKVSPEKHLSGNTCKGSALNTFCCSWDNIHQLPLSSVRNWNACFVTHSATCIGSNRHTRDSMFIACAQWP